ILDAGLVARVTDVEDLAVALAVLVLDDTEQALDALSHVREAALLPAAVDQEQRRAFDEIQDQLRDRARAADAGRLERIEPRPEPVERPEQRELEALRAVRPDHAIQRLLRRRVDPALLVDGAEYQPRL